MAKAMICKAGQSTGFECQFNPKEFSITKEVSWYYEQKDGHDVGPPYFAGGKPQNFDVDLVFDSTDTGTDVRQKYQDLVDMAKIDMSKKDATTQKSEPPQCELHWGPIVSFSCVIKKMTQQFVLFKDDGTPLRAKVKLTLTETPPTLPPTNPTTRTESRKIWVVHEGQRLDWIAYQEYENVGHWRHIAETNDLDNPMDLQPGQVLKLVPLP